MMKNFREKLEKQWAIESSDLKDTIQDIPQLRRLCIEYKDEEIKEEFHRVINSKDLKDIDDKKHDDYENIDVEKVTSTEHAQRWT